MHSQRFSPLRLAVLVGVIGATLLGLRESLATIESNAFVQPTQYFLTYLAVPVLLDLIWVGPVALGTVLIARLVRLPREPLVLLPFYVAPWAFLIAIAGLLPTAMSAAERLREVGVAGLPVVIPWLLVTILSSAAALTVAAAVSAFSNRLLRALPWMCGVCAVLVGLLALPAARFLLTDWRWSVASASNRTARSDRPNVLVISIDTLRADYLSPYGATSGEPTPHLERFAQQGTLFEEAFSAAPWTLPSVASLMTALTPLHHGAGMITNRRDPLGRAPLPSESWTLASALRDQGYRTHAIVTNPYLALRYGLGLGFESYENISIESEAFIAFRETLLMRLVERAWPYMIVGDTGQTVSAHAERWLMSSAREQPFFLWLHYIDPHPPYRRANVARDKSFRGDTELGSSGTMDLNLSSPDVARLRSGEIRLDATEKEVVRSLYRAEVAEVDAAIGSVLLTLDRLGLRDQTLVVLVADHGEEFWDHGGVEHGHTLYDELLHVPLILRWPGHVPAGRRVPELVRLIDVAPTILDLMDLPAQAAADGMTMLPVITGEEHTGRTAVAANLLFAEERVALRTSEYKYIHWDNGKEELYHLSSDPGEQRDLAGSVEQAAAFRTAYLASLKEISLAQIARASPTRDGATEEALHALGYVH